MFVRLVLAGGTKTGLVAEIKEGFYLIGRNEECQIRPESESVSDRHCLLHHEGIYFRVFVLDEDSPTLVNHKPLPPKEWVLLNHGDMLQVGRVPFMVVVTAQDPSLPAAANPAATAQQPASPSATNNDAAAATSSEQDFATRDTAEIDAEDVVSDADNEAENKPKTETSEPPSRWKDR